MKFVAYQDNSGQWRWRLVAENGRIVADSSEGYVSRNNVDRAIEMVREAFSEPEERSTIGIPKPGERGDQNGLE